MHDSLLHIFLSNFSILTSSWWGISGTGHWRSSSPVQCVSFTSYAAFATQVVIIIKKLSWEEARTVRHHSTDTTNIVESSTALSACI